MEAFEVGRWIEYQCYDDAGGEQGRAELELQKWEAASEGLFTARHGIASDQYYNGTLRTEHPMALCSTFVEAKLQAAASAWREVIAGRLSTWTSGAC